MQNIKRNTMLLCSLVFIYVMLYFTFKNEAVFWYLYAFTMLVCMALAIIGSKFEDQLPTWHYLLYGIGYGTITYGIIRFGYFLAPYIDDNLLKEVTKFLNIYSPTNIGHYLLLIFIISIGEELFWRGFVQQKLKHFVQPFVAVLITTLLCTISIALSGFLLGAIAAFVVSVIFGLLYEWRKSMPLIIVAHVVFVLLLFLVLPLP